MLDNLKLGYGGTKEEMARLISHANELKVAMGESADLTIDSYADVVEAIHLVQEEMKITGTTYNEAEKTVSGSIAMMKAAWSNFMSGLAQDNADIPKLVNDVVSSAATVLANVIPVAKEILTNIPVAISEISPEAGAAAQVVVDAVITAFESIDEVGAKIAEFFTWVSNNWETIKNLGTVILIVAGAMGTFAAISAVVNAVLYASPITWIIALIVALCAAIAACIVYWDEIKAAIIAAWEAIKEAVAAGVEAVITFFANLWSGIVGWVTGIYDSVTSWFNNLVATIGEIFTGAVEAVSTAWESIKSAITEKVEAAKTAVSTTFEAIKTGISEKVNAAKTFVQTGFNAIKTNISTKLSEAKNTATSTFEGIKTGIKEKVDGAKNFVQSGFESIKGNISTKLNAAKNTVTSVFNSIKSGIEEKINGARDKVSEAIEKIKSFFNFSWSLPPLKLPHISISGKFSLNPISVPKFSISWNALGGVFDSPTLFGFGDSLQGIGEDGAEAVVPLEKNLGWLDKLAGMLDERMNKRGTTPVVLQVDGKVFAQTSIDTINALTRQTGTLALNIV
jgi:phage-related protein